MIPVVAGSNPVGHPTKLSKSPRKWQPPRVDCAGVPGAACAALASAALSQVVANVPGTLEGSDPEYLHQLRVGIRRLRAVLRIFRKTTSKAKWLDRKLRRLLPPLGEARDWDVFVARHGEGKGRQRAARVRCRTVLVSKEFSDFLIAARRWARHNSLVGRAPLSAFAAKALDRLHRKVLKRAQGVDWRDAERRHAVRIALKRLRYACDFFAPCFEDAGAYLEKLEKLQDLLGDLNDIAVARRLGSAQLAPALAKRETALVSRLAPAWAALERRPCFWRADRRRPPAAAR